ncbi:MAG: penicillin-binding protein 2 [Verrucomicrobiota bacterium]|nr:penicillin-binding protein 2 [Verrucomicrobiota bacterium]
MVSAKDTGEMVLLRLRILTLGMFLAMAFLVVALWRVQVLHGSRYEKNLDKQSIRRTRIPGARGRILDRHGVALAENRPSFCIAVYVEELRQPGRLSRTVNKVDSVLDRVSAVLGLPKEVTRDDIKNHVGKRRPMEFLAWKDVDHGILARFAESRVTFEGVGIYVEPVRTYPQGALAAHALGYVSRADPNKFDDESYHFYLPEMEGRDGLEKALNWALSGTAGGRLARVDAAGYRREDLGGIDPIPGQDVVLALDARIQKLAEASLGTNRGATVVLDPRNGDVLALASAPGYDPNTFSRSISERQWKQIRSDVRKTLLNRAVAGIYPPGSVFKPVVALTALENRCAAPSAGYNCSGAFQLGNVSFRCWKNSGHGELNMVGALEQSCNAFFCHLGVLCGNERIYHMAAAMGLGEKTGVEVAWEEPGILPNDAWKQRVYGDKWRLGDTCNIAIGQGMLAATPLQMAMVMAAIANGGRVYRPRLVLHPTAQSAQPVRSEQASYQAVLGKTQDGNLARDLHWSAETRGTLVKGLRGVVNADTGTGKRARLANLVVAGKTGTAEFGKKEEGRKHTWMAAFAPADNPTRVAVILIEEGESGGRTAAPRIRTLMAGIFGVSETREDTAPAPGRELD